MGIKVTFEEFNMPGAPPGAKSVLENMNQRAEAHHSCLTPEEAKKPKEDFFAGAGKNCRYEHFNMGGGKIDAVMKCTEEGMGQTMTMAGTYGPTDYHMKMAMKAEGMPGPASGMSMKMRVDAKRIGECDGRRTLNFDANGGRDDADDHDRRCRGGFARRLFGRQRRRPKAEEGRGIAAGGRI